MKTISVAYVLKTRFYAIFYFNFGNALNIIDASPIQQALVVASIKLNTGFGGMINA